MSGPEPPPGSQVPPPGAYTVPPAGQGPADAPVPPPGSVPATPGPPPPPAFQQVATPPPESSQPNWLLGLGIVGVVVVVALVVGFLLFGGSPAASPSPSLVARPTSSPPPPTAGPLTAPPPTTPAPSATPAGSATPGASAMPVGSVDPGPTGAPIPPDIASQIDAVVAGVPPLRQLEQLRPVPYVFITRQDFQAGLLDLLAEEMPPERMAAEERFLKRMGLLPDDADLEQMILDLYGSQVAAFYRPDTGTFYVIERDAPFGAYDKIIVAHEYTHALQDQHFDLEGTRISDPSQGDAVLAQLAAIEGDATLTMFQWGFANIPDEMASLGDAVSPTDLELLESMPPILRRQLEFPYGEGFFFALELYTSQLGNWEPINEALRNPPATTEQILHSEKYRAGEPAISVAMPNVAGALGAGWQETYTQTLGELNVQVWVGGGEDPIETIPGFPPEQPHSGAAAGWGGDRLAMYESTDGRWAIAWEIAWDTQADADEFLDRALELQGTLDGVSAIVLHGQDRVRLLLADGATTLADLEAALGD